VYKFQNINETVVYNAAENDLASDLNAQGYDTWSKKLPGMAHGSRARRDRLKQKIKEQLLTIQDGYCAYCGISFSIRGGNSSIHREHVAPKHIDVHIRFIFEPQNLVLACSRCNGFDYKGSKNYLTLYDEDYSVCEFSIVHPHLDDFFEHLTDQNGIIIEIVNDSEKGQKSLKEFGINDESEIMIRGAFKKIKAEPLSDEDENLLSSILERSYNEK
jgi:uncharacterized protein (TIGR02646 family)